MSYQRKSYHLTDKGKLHDHRDCRKKTKEMLRSIFDPKRGLPRRAYACQ